MTVDKPLSGLNVLVTRPAARAQRLCAMIEQAGGTALHFATIEIAEPVSTQSRDDAIGRIADYAIAIFISPTAVERTLQRITALPRGLVLACIGSRTAAALVAGGYAPDIVPDGHDSAALLREDGMQASAVSGRRIIIFRGENGRDELADTLTERGAHVFQADMYRRRRPACAGDLPGMIARVDVITVSSNEGLDNLYALAGDSELTARPLVVPGERARQRALTLGFEHIICAASATDSDCLDALKSYARSIRTGNTE